MDSLKKRTDKVDSAEELDIDSEAGTRASKEEEEGDSDRGHLRASEKSKRQIETRKDPNSKEYVSPKGAAIKQEASRVHECLRSTRSSKKISEGPVKQEEQQTECEALLRELQREALGLRTKNKRLSANDRDTRRGVLLARRRERQKQKEQQEEEEEEEEVELQKEKKKQESRDKAAKNKQNDGKKTKKEKEKEKEATKVDGKKKGSKKIKKDGEERKQVAQEKIKEQMFLEGRRVTRNMLKRGIQENNSTTTTKKGRTSTTTTTQRPSRRSSLKKCASSRKVTIYFSIITFSFKFCSLFLLSRFSLLSLLSYSLRSPCQGLWASSIHLSALFLRKR